MAVEQTKKAGEVVTINQSVGTSSVGSPSAQAFRFVLDGQEQQYDAYIDLVTFDNFKSLDVRYRPQGDSQEKWKYLLGREFRYEEIDTESKILREFARLLDEQINPKIEEVFGAAGDRPVKGWELVQWIVSVGLVEQNNVISLKG